MANTRTGKVSINNTNSAASFIEREENNPYLMEARKFPPFSREEELDAVQKARSGKKSDVDNFINHNLLLVFAMAKHFMHLGVPLSDLIQYGNMGLIVAANSYIEGDLWQVNRFSSYAVWYIRKYITDGIEEYQMVQKPHMVHVNNLKVKKAMEELSNIDSEIVLDVERISEHLGMSMKDVANAIGTDTDIVSTDTVIGDEDDKTTTLGDIMLKSDMLADDGIAKEDRRIEIEMLLNRLNSREKMVVKMTFGIGYDYEREPEGIADELGLGAERVRQILKGAMAKMKSAASK